MSNSGQASVAADVVVSASEVDEMAEKPA